MPRKRAIERDNRVEVLGGSFHGVTCTDPAGRPLTVPFTGESTDVLGGDGTFTALPPTATSPTAWGGIVGTLSNQVDLQTALNAKQDVLVFNPLLCAYVIPDV